MELYDLVNDPFEMNNLASDPDYLDTLQHMKDLLFTTLFKIRDLGFLPEPIAEELGSKYGNKYYIFQHPENRNLLGNCIETIRLYANKDLYGLKRALRARRSFDQVLGGIWIGQYG